MLLLSKTNSSARLILTLTESSSETLFDLVAQSFYTNKTYTIDLGEDVSEHTERYNEFNVDLSAFEQMESGRYTYKIVERETGNVIEHGVLTVTDSEDREYVAITPDEDEDDFITIQD